MRLRHPGQLLSLYLAYFVLSFVSKSQPALRDENRIDAMMSQGYTLSPFMLRMHNTKLPEQSLKQPRFGLDVELKRSSGIPESGLSARDHTR